MTITLPAFFASLDWSHLIAAVLPVVLLAVSARYPALAPILSILFPKTPAPVTPPVPTPTPAPTPGPSVPNHPILDGLLQLLLSPLMKKNGTTDPVSAVVKELGAFESPGK